LLPPFIIEQIRQREERERVRDDQPRLELPLPMKRPPARNNVGGGSVGEEDPDLDRGVVILDLG
jgi:hypothetical protein